MKPLFLIPTILIAASLIGCGNDTPKGTVKLAGRLLLEENFNLFSALMTDKAAEKTKDVAQVKELKTYLAQFEEFSMKTLSKEKMNANDIRHILALKGQKINSEESLPVLNLEVICSASFGSIQGVADNSVVGQLDEDHIPRNPKDGFGDIPELDSPNRYCKISDFSK